MRSLLKHIRYYYYHVNIEAFIWIAALLYLALINPYEKEHLNLCLFHHLGIDFCLGCGLGRSISMILHGDLSASFNIHPLGFFALFVLSYRIVSLLTGFRIKFLKNREVYHG